MLEAGSDKLIGDNTGSVCDEAGTGAEDCEAGKDDDVGGFGTCGAEEMAGSDGVAGSDKGRRFWLELESAGSGMKVELETLDSSLRLWTTNGAVSPQIGKSPGLRLQLLLVRIIELSTSSLFNLRQDLWTKAMLLKLNE